MTLKSKFVKWFGWFLFFYTFFVLGCGIGIFLRVPPVPAFVTSYLLGFILVMLHYHVEMRKEGLKP